MSLFESTRGAAINGAGSYAIVPGELILNGVVSGQLWTLWSVKSRHPPQPHPGFGNGKFRPALPFWKWLYLLKGQLNFWLLFRVFLEERWNVQRCNKVVK